MAEPSAGAPEDHRLGPRRRGDRLLAAVHAAVLDELAERGYAALTVEAVAARARVGKASLYRRWPGKRELVLAAVQAGVPDPEALPDTGSLREDLVAYLTQVADHLSGPAGAAMRGILGDRPGGASGADGAETTTAVGGAPELYETAHRRRSMARLQVLAERAVARGELPQYCVDAVTTRQWEAGPAVLRHHFLWEGVVGPELCAEVVDEVVLPLLTIARRADQRSDAEGGGVR